MNYRIFNVLSGWNKFKYYKNDTLFMNSLFLFLGRSLNASAGFFFWILAARLYSVEDVGLTSAYISSLNIVILFSLLGFDFSIIRFLPIYSKSKVFNTCLTITICSTIIVCFIYIIGSKIFSPSLFYTFSPANMIIFSFFCIASSILSITGNTLLALRRGSSYFFQTIINSLRIPLLILLVHMGSLGAFGSIGISSIVASLFALLLISKSIRINFKIDSKFIKESFKFSSFNYLANNLFETPILVLPIIVLNLLGKAEAANFYIAFAIANLIFMIPTIIGTSLFVEGSHGENLRKNVFKSVVATYLILIPIIIFIYFFGGFVLSIYGEGYTQAVLLLRLFALSSLFVAVCLIFIPIQNILMNVKNVLILNFFLCVMLLGMSYNFILRFGLIGIGYAWIITFGLLALLIVIYVNNKYSIKRFLSMNWKMSKEDN